VISLIFISSNVPPSAIQSNGSGNSKLFKMNSLHGLELLSPSERKEFSKNSQGPRIQTPFTLIHQAFENRVDTQPKDIAVEHEDRAITYYALEQSANVLANKLMQRGLLPGQKVCLVAQRSIPMIAAILAILKCGCQYVPLDGGVIPKQVLSHIIENTKSTFVLCLRQFEIKTKHCVGSQSVLIIDDITIIHGDQQMFERPALEIDASSGAYVIYTSGQYITRVPRGSILMMSGTTGLPKGVDVTHQNVTNLLCLQPGSLGITRGICVSQLLSVSFDMGIQSPLFIIVKPHLTGS
jgi:non-ribosomal peptide synthetase component F